MGSEWSPSASDAEFARIGERERRRKRRGSDGRSAPLKTHLQPQPRVDRRVQLRLPHEAGLAVLEGRLGRRVVVHAGVHPEKHLEEHTPFELPRIRHLDQRRRPWWFERYAGEPLVLYGHSFARLPQARRVRRRLATLGVDTGCVYGGALTAYAPELDEFVRIPAARAYAA